MKRLFIALLLTLTMACEATENMGAAETIKDVKAKHEAQLLAMQGVVSVGIGQDDKGQAVIVIGVDSKGILDSVNFPQQLEGYPVMVQFIGPVRAR